MSANPRIGLVTVVRDEQRLMGEFIAHHAGLGIERMHVLDNLSTDATPEILLTAAAGMPGLSMERWPGGQMAGFNRGLEVLRGEVDWLLAIDCDEFLVAPTGQDLGAFLAGMANFPAIGINWAVFGSSGFTRDPGDLFTASFLRRGPDRLAQNRHVKSLIRTDMAREAETPHTFHFRDHRIEYVNCVREKLTWVQPGLCVNQPVLAPFRLHHYFCRYRDSWEQKIARSTREPGSGHGSTRTEADWAGHDRNELEDRSALRHTLKTRGIMNRLGLAIAPPDLNAPIIQVALPAAVTVPLATPAKPELAPAEPQVSTAPAPRPRKRSRAAQPAASWIELRAAELIAAADRAEGDEATWLRHHAGCYAAWAAELAAL